jgi:hypothetical protein
VRVTSPAMSLDFRFETGMAPSFLGVEREPPACPA